MRHQLKRAQLCFLAAVTAIENPDPAGRQLAASVEPVVKDRHDRGPRRRIGAATDGEVGHDQAGAGQALADALAQANRRRACSWWLDAAARSVVQRPSPAFGPSLEELEASEAQIRQEQVVRADLGRYLPGDLVEQIVRRERRMKLGGERRAVTVLFADVVASTPLPERRSWATSGRTSAWSTRPSATWSTSRARLETIARPGQILVTGATRDEAGVAFEVHRVG